jgi:hypothetical protein
MTENFKTTKQKKKALKLSERKGKIVKDNLTDMK